MDNSMQRGGRMVGNSKSYGMSRPQQAEWRFGDTRTFKDSQMQGTSRQHGDIRFQDSRLLLDSRMEPNYPPQRILEAAGIPGNARVSERIRGGPQPQREVRAHPEPRMHPGARLQGNNIRMHDDLPLQDQVRSRSDSFAYDYNHQRTGDYNLSKDTGVQSDFMMNTNENMRSDRIGYNVQDNNGRQGFSDILPSLSNDGSMKRNSDYMEPKNYGPLTGIPPGAGHILTPSLTSSSGPQLVDDVRPTGNRGSYPKEKSSKAFDYLKNWRLKMNMPTDSFLLEKEGLVGNQQQGHNVMSSNAHDDWYTQLPTAEPRVGRAIIDQQWSYSGNSFAEKDVHGERSDNKQVEIRYGTGNESVGMYPRDQALESGRTGPPAWKWDDGTANTQSQSGKRNYESMASGPAFNMTLRENRGFHGEMMQAKRSRLSPSVMQNEREAMKQLTSMIPEQAHLPQSNAMYSDDAKYGINASDTFQESNSEWRTSSFHGRPPSDVNKFTRPPYDARGENVGSRHKPFAGDEKGMAPREGSKGPYSQSGDVRNLSHEPPHSQRSLEPLGRETRYAEHHPQDRPPKLPGHGRSPLPNQSSIDQGGLSITEVLMSSGHYLLDESAREYQRSRSQRFPGLGRSTGPGMRDKSPPPFTQSKSLTHTSETRDRSPLWRKGKSPGPGRERHLGAERGRSPTRGGRGSFRPPGKDRSPGSGERGGLVGSSGKHISPGSQRFLGPPRRARSPELVRRAKSPEPYRKMRSPGSPRRPLGPQGRGRSPESGRKERSPLHLGSGRPLNRGGWKSPERSSHHSGKGRSPRPYGGERPLGSSAREKSPMHREDGRFPSLSGEGKPTGPPRGPSSGPQERGRSPVKSHTRVRGSPRKIPPESLGRSSSPGPIRHRSTGTYGRGRSPVTTDRDRSQGGRGFEKHIGGSGRGRTPGAPNMGRFSRPINSGSSEFMPNKSAEHKEHSRSRGQVGDFSVQTTRSVKGNANSGSYPSRGRSPLKEKASGGTRIRSESFSRGNSRHMSERSPRRISRFSRSPVRKLPNENLMGNEYGEFREKIERSPYFEEISSSPRYNKVGSPTRRTVMERSHSIDALQRGCSPVSPQSGGRNLYLQEGCNPERGDNIRQGRSPQLFRDGPSQSTDNLQNEMRDRSGKWQDGFDSPREVSLRAGRHSAEKVHNAKGRWREHSKDRRGQHHDEKRGVGKVSATKDVKTLSGEFPDISGRTLSEEEVDDEDLRIHLLRLREQKVEMKLMKLEEESKETELKLRELKNRTPPRRESPVMAEGRYPEEEVFLPHGRRQESFPRKYQHSPPPPERFHRQHKKY